LLGWVFAQV
nr:Chain C, LEU-LEU-GLY-TRP-VAL-PHE-ALA-GLN-VAL [Homo sapiens]6Z9W_F Chain F, LEU-LEU-GLY-TRP-VAL-PHE-ALA-GLN-VAL [Homo sapiens]